MANGKAKLAPPVIKVSADDCFNGEEEIPGIPYEEPTDPGNEDPGNEDPGNEDPDPELCGGVLVIPGEC